MMRKVRKMPKLVLTSGSNLTYNERIQVFWLTSSTARGRSNLDASVEGIIHNYNAIRRNNNPANILARRTESALLDVIENGVKVRRHKKSTRPNNVVTLIAVNA